MASNKRAIKGRSFLGDFVEQLVGSFRVAGERVEGGELRGEGVVEEAGADDEGVELGSVSD